MFVRFSCGCEGLRLADGKAIVLHACDAESAATALGFHFREIDGADQPLDPNRAKSLSQRLSYTINLGQEFRQVAVLFKHAALE
jgi:hypothetical protein